MLFCPQRSGVKTRPCLQAPYILCTFYFLLHHESRHGWKALCEVRTPGPGEGGVRQELWGVVHTHTHTSPTLRASPSPSPADSTDFSPGPWSALWSLCLSVTSQGALLGLSLLSFKPSQGPLRSPQFLDFPIRGSSPCHFKPPHLWVPTPRRVPIRSSCSQFRSENSISPEESSHPPEEHVLWFTPCTGRNDTTCSSL